MMRGLLIALLTAGLLVAGCAGDNGAPETTTTTNVGSDLDCPSEDDLVSSAFDLGTNPRGFPSPRIALARFLATEGFLGGEGQNLDANQFSGETKSDTAEISYSDDGRKFAHVFVRKLDRGWLVVAYDFCRGQL